MPTSPTTRDLLVEIRDGIATLTLNRPDSLNALSSEMITAAVELLPELGREDRVGVVVITGAGRAFCAGGDVKAMALVEGAQVAGEGLGFEQRVDNLRRGQELSWLLHSLPKVTVAAINGHAMGAGLGIALSCDLRLASAAAKLGTAYARVGFGGDFGVTWQLTRLVGPAKAKELLFLAEALSAQEAHRVGLLNWVVETERFADEVASLARRLASGPLVSYRWMKENVNLAVHQDFRSLLDREAITHLRCGQTEDHREGVAAFAEKREPRFQGR
jgi:2-(1,2-epoxy-1,2-dihydrophenyl)acetyl-CoA isomerase